MTAEPECLGSVAEVVDSARAVRVRLESLLESGAVSRDEASELLGEIRRLLDRTLLEAVKHLPRRRSLHLVADNPQAQRSLPFITLELVHTQEDIA